MHVSTVLPRSLTCCNSLKVVATPGRLYIVGRKPLTDEGNGERADAAYRILEFDRTLQAPGSLSEIVFEHDRNYSQQEAEHLLRDLVTPWLGAGSAGAASLGGGSSSTGSSGQGPTAVAAAAIPALSLSSSLYGDSSASSSWASGAVLVFDAVALVGAITFTRGCYLVLITKGQKVGTIGDHAVWVPKATEFLPIAVEPAAGKASAASAAGSAVLGAFGGKLSEALQPRLASLGTLGLTLAGSDAAAIAESRYQSLFLSIDLTREFMYSDSYDLTRPLQQQVVLTVDGRAASMSSEQGERAGGPVEMFTWSSYLRSELLHPDTGPCISALTGTRISSWWSTPIIHGYFRQVTIRALGAPVLVTLIARRSRHFAGTRYLKRGADPLGHVANEVETEQIVEDCSGGRTGIQGTGAGTTFSSFVHMRGSIPCYWTQTTSVAVPKPPIVLQPRDPLHGPARHHFSDLFARYGGTVMCLNLVKKKEKGTPREKLLGREYARLVCALNRELPPVVELSRPGQGVLHAMSALQQGGTADVTDKQDKEAMPSRLQYLHLDYNGIVKSNQHNVLAILRDAGRWALSTTGCFASAMLPAAVEERRYRARMVKAALEVVCRPVGPAGVHDLALVVVDPDDTASSSKREQTRLTVDTITDALPVPGAAVTVLPASTGSSANLLSSLSKQRKGAPGTPSLSFMNSASGTLGGGTSRLPHPAASEASGVAAAGDALRPYLPSLSAIGSIPAVMFLDSVSSAEGVDLMNTFVRTEIHKSADKCTGLEYLRSKMHDQSSITGIFDSAEAAPCFSGVLFTPCHVRPDATNRTVPVAVPKHHSHARGAISKHSAQTHSYGKQSFVDWDCEPADGPKASVLGPVLSQWAGEVGTGHASKGQDGRTSYRRNSDGPPDHAVSPVSALTSASSQADDEDEGLDPAAQGGGRSTPQDDPATHAEDEQQLPTPVVLQQDEDSRALEVAAVAIAAALDADDNEEREEDARTRLPVQVADTATSTMQIAPQTLTLERLRALSSASPSVLGAPALTPVAQGSSTISTPTPMAVTAQGSGGTKGVTASTLFGRLGFGAKAATGSSSSFGSPGAAPAVTPVTLSLDLTYDGSSKGDSLQPEGPSLFGTMYVELVKGYGTSMSVKPSAGEGGVSSSGDKDEDYISTSANVLDPDPFPEDESPGSSTAGITPSGGALPGVSSALSGPGSLLGLDMGGSRTLVITSSSSSGVGAGLVVQTREEKSAALQEAVGQALHVRSQEEAARAASEARHTFCCTSDQDAIVEEETGKTIAGKDKGGKGGNKNRAGLAQRMREYASISGQGEYTYIDLVPAAAEGAVAATAAQAPPVPMPKLQRGVLRTNCVDCLDRTNVAQLTVGLYALGVQLGSLGLDAGDAQPDASSPFVRALMDMYTEHGDAIARQYGGSEANKKVTATAHADGIAHQEATGAERGSGRAQGREKIDSEKATAGSGWSIFGGSSLSSSGGKEAVAAAQAQLTSHVGRLKLASSGPGEILTSLQRYYSNSFTDSIKQAAINLFLGVYQPRLHGPNGQMAGKGLIPGVHLWEMESDWCLHSASSLPATALVPASTLQAPVAGDWWSAPLAKYAQVGYPTLAKVQVSFAPTPSAVKAPQVVAVLSSFDDDASLAPVGGQLTMAARIPTPTAHDAGIMSPWKSQSGEDRGAEGAMAAAVPAASSGTAPRPPTGRPPRSGVTSSASGAQPGTPTVAPGGSNGKGSKRSNSIDSTASSGGTPVGKSGTPRSAGGTPTRSRLADDRFGMSLFADVLNPAQLAERASQKAAAAIARLEDRLEAVADNAADVAKAGARSVVGHAWQAVTQASGAVQRVTRQGISAASQVVDAVDAVSEGVQDAMSTAASVLLPPFAAIQQLEEEEIARLRAAAPETGPDIEESKPVLEHELGEEDGDGSLASQLNLAPSLLSPLQPAARVRKGHPSLASVPSTGFGTDKPPGNATSSQGSLAPDYRHFERDSWFGQHATVQLSESDTKLYESYCALAGVVAGGSGSALGTKMPSLAAPKVHVLTERTEIERFRRVLAVGQPALLSSLPMLSGAPPVLSKSASPSGAAPQAPAALSIDPVENVAPPADVWQWSDHGVITKGPFSGMPHDRPAGPVLRSLVSRGEVDRAALYREEVAQGSGTSLRKWVHAPAVLLLQHSGPKAW